MTESCNVDTIIKKMEDISIGNILIRFNVHERTYIKNHTSKWKDIKQLININSQKELKINTNIKKYKYKNMYFYINHYNQDTININGDTVNIKNIEEKSYNSPVITNISESIRIFINSLNTQLFSENLEYLKNDYLIIMNGYIEDEITKKHGIKYKILEISYS